MKLYIFSAILRTHRDVFLAALAQNIAAIYQYIFASTVYFIERVPHISGQILSRKLRFSRMLF